MIEHGTHHPQEAENLKRETESLLITAQNVIKTNYIYIYQPLRSGRIWHKVNF